MTGIPVVSIVGKSDSGKTTVVEQLVRRLVDRGHRVATCKHHVHEIDIDVPGKDSWRHARAGAQVTMISAPTQFAVVSKVERERTLEEIVAAAGDVDILITEGFKRSGSVRIEVSRRARSDELVSAPAELTALITDNNDLQPEGVSRFELNDYDALTDFVERSFLDGGSPHGD
ncbi:MAG: molybdopterin-guanine dinucleotide biosynthesis protein B [Coriobacteriia bacterium]|nr:molybdopterin-guanine dinucleotide biosynthesis protein B [Coriobacteriia bacterium]